MHDVWVHHNKILITLLYLRFWSQRLQTTTLLQFVTLSSSLASVINLMKSSHPEAIAVTGWSQSRIAFTANCKFMVSSLIVCTEIKKFEILYK